MATDGAWAAGRVNDITRQVWAKNLSATEVAVLLVNVGDVPQTLSVAFERPDANAAAADRGQQSGRGAAPPASRIAAGTMPVPCTREPCADGVPGWDQADPLHRWYCRPCAAAAAAGGAPKMAARDLWSGAALPAVEDGVLRVGPLAAHDSALVLLTLAG